MTLAVGGMVTYNSCINLVVSYNGVASSTSQDTAGGLDTCKSPNTGFNITLLIDLFLRLKV